MLNIRLVDNDQVVRVLTDLDAEGKEDHMRHFLHRIKEELVPGETAYLEIEGFDAEPITFEISQFE